MLVFINPRDEIKLLNFNDYLLIFVIFIVRRINFKLLNLIELVDVVCNELLIEQIISRDSDGINLYFKVEM